MNIAFGGDLAPKFFLNATAVVTVTRSSVDDVCTSVKTALELDEADLLPDVLPPLLPDMYAKLLCT